MLLTRNVPFSLHLCGGKSEVPNSFGPHPCPLPLRGRGSKLFTLRIFLRLFVKSIEKSLSRQFFDDGVILKGFRRNTFFAHEFQDRLHCLRLSAWDAVQVSYGIAVVILHLLGVVEMRVFGDDL